MASKHIYCVLLRLCDRGGEIYLGKDKLGKTEKRNMCTVKHSKSQTGANSHWNDRLSGKLVGKF